MITSILLWLRKSLLFISVVSFYFFHTLLLAQSTKLPPWIPKSMRGLEVHDAATEDPWSLVEEARKYSTGDGVKKDIDRAVELYTRALHLGNSYAGFMLETVAEDLTRHKGDRGSRTKAKTIFEIYNPAFEKCDLTSDFWAMLAMSLSYSTGTGIPAQPRRAALLCLKYFDANGETGSAIAFNRSLAAACVCEIAERALRSVDNDNIDDLDVTLRLLPKAAEMGFNSAYNLLGWMHENGKGCEKSAKEAADLYQKGAEMGDTDAQANLARLYENGIGVLRDYTRALMWLNVAAIGGDERIVSRRDALERRMSPKQVDAAQTLAQAFLAKQQQGASASTPSPSPKQLRPVASGTGFFITADGYLLTNFHVIQGATKVTTLLPDASCDAEVIATDQHNDLAVLKVAGTFSPIPLGTTKEVSLGDSVFTIGFPNIKVQGRQPKLTRGEISSLSGVEDDPRLFQISVPLQPGNSGGPLVNDAGNVIGITAAQLDALGMARSGNSIPQNVNYAIKISYVSLLLESTRIWGTSF